MKSKKIRESARGEDCQVRIPNVCNFNPETTVLAHVGSDKKMGGKCSDLEAAYCCSNCHDVGDYRVKNHEFMRCQIDLMMKEGAERTRKILLEKGLIEVK